MDIEEYHISKQVLDRFCVAGINHHKADTAIRGLFHIDHTNFSLLAASAKAIGIRSLFVVSTCNRTEIYGFAESVMILAELLVQHTKGNKTSFYEHGYFKNGDSALDHLFNVASGLDSQILGDYEILGQLKRASDLSKEYQLIGPIMDRVLNFTFQASKKIKTETHLSNGTVSVSFAAIELLQKIPAIQQKKILVLGTGKFGMNVCKNLRTYLPGTSISITNRTDASAMVFAEANQMNFIPYAERKKAIDDADIMIVCTNAQEPTVLSGDIRLVKEKLILDLSVPLNVDINVKKLPHVKVIDVDEISTSILDKTIAKRRKEIPQAEAIIRHYKIELLQWLQNYRYSLHLKDWKNKLSEIDLNKIHVCEFHKDDLLINETDRVIRAQKAVKQLAVNLKVKNDKGCQFISSINDYLQTN